MVGGDWWECDSESVMLTVKWAVLGEAHDLGYQQVSTTH